jgi:hypothetical protein
MTTSAAGPRRIAVGAAPIGEPVRAAYDCAMDRELVHSRALRSVGYDRDANTLELEFTSGTLYRYFDVPEFTHRALMLAKSKGHFFQTSIDRRFRFEEVK